MVEAIVIRSDSDYYGKKVFLIRKVGKEWVAVPESESKKGMKRTELRLLEKDIKTV